MLNTLTKQITSRSNHLAVFFRSMWAGNSWSNRLTQMGNDLLTAGRSSENEFLNLGEKLQYFSVRSAEIARTCSSVTDQFSGPEISGAIQLSRDLFDRIRQIEDRSGQGTEVLRNILESICALQNDLFGLSKIIMHLQVLCISIKIESARVCDEENGFKMLGDNVAKMIQDIESHRRQLTSLSESLKQFLEQTVASVVSLDEARAEQARIILERALSNLRALTQKNEQSSRAATEIKARYEEISRNINEIVSSMQIHDMTRQRLEHSATSLFGLTKEWDQQADATADVQKVKNLAARFRERILSVPLLKRGEGMRHWFLMTGKICMLQKEQLRGASEELVKAVETIIENMKNIASLIFEVSESSSALAGDACGAGASFLAGIEQGILSIQAAFSGYSQARDELAAAITSAGSALSDMRSYTEEIQAIGSKMKLIGLNAVVKASHMKEEGTALGVVAEALHHLSKESVKRIESVYEVLSGITATAETIKGEAGAAKAESAFDPESMTNELKTRISGLREAGERAFSLLEGANSEGQALSGEIRATVSNIKVHRKIAENINSTIAGLEEISALYSRDLSDQAVSGAEGYLESLEDSYTMQVQRQVHQAVMGDPPHNGGNPKTGSSKQEFLSDFEDREICLPATSDLESQANLSIPEGDGQFEHEESEFGDNVELF